MSVIIHVDEFLAQGKYKVSYDHTFNFDNFDEAKAFADKLYQQRVAAYKAYGWVGDPPVRLYIPKEVVQ